jgi:hypothetical protein
VRCIPHNEVAVSNPFVRIQHIINRDAEGTCDQGFTLLPVYVLTIITNSIRDNYSKIKLRRPPEYGLLKVDRYPLRDDRYASLK